MSFNEIIDIIPRRIFYVWLGSSKPADVLACLYQWQQALPGYEIIELNEHSEQYFDFAAEQEKNPWFRTVYEKKMWAYAADYMRCKALYDHGGIYLDTDISVVKSFEPLLQEPAFIGKQSADSVNLAVIGCRRHNAFMKDILDIYAGDIWKLPVYSIPDIATYLLENKYHLQFKKSDTTLRLPEMTIFPQEWFYPYAYHSDYKADCITAESYTVHWWKESWCRPEISHWLKNKHLHTPQENMKLELFPVRRIYLLGCLHLFDYDGKSGVVRLAGIKIPLLKIKPVYNRVKVLLFNFIPLLKIR